MQTDNQHTYMLHTHTHTYTHTYILCVYIYVCVCVYIDLLNKSPILHKVPKSHLRNE